MKPLLLLGSHKRRRHLLSFAQAEEWLHEAIRTLAAMPDKERRWIYHKMASWPDVLRAAIDMMAQVFDNMRQGKAAFEAVSEPPPVARYVPTKPAIDRMDEALDWLTALDKRQLTLVTLRAFEVSWYRIGDRMHASEYLVKKWYAEAIEKVRARAAENRDVAAEVRQRIQADRAGAHRSTLARRARR